MDDNLPTEFDLIVIGTGLTESILAAAASRIGKTVLHIDPNDYYGGSWASFNLENIQALVNSSQLNTTTNSNVNETSAGIVQINGSNNSSIIKNATNEWASITVTTAPTKEEHMPLTENVDNKFELRDCVTENVDEFIWTKEKVLGEFRKFNIDITPKLLFARGDLVELLIASNVCRYAEFRAVDKITTVTKLKNEIKAVPCSRSDVFTNKDVNVVEKRLLMKILGNCMNLEDNADEFKEFEDKTFKNYLESKRLTPNLIHYILYAISMSNAETLCIDGIRRTRKFLQSLGRYGNTPFLFPMYGCGEIPQCFCRLCAVFGGVYCLKRPIAHLKFNETFDEFHAIKCGEQIINAKMLVLGNGGASVSASDIFKQRETDNVSNGRKCGNLSRAIFITTKPLGDEALSSGGGGVNLLKLPGTKSSCSNNGAFVIQLSHYSGTCPKGLYLIHITCSSESSDPKLDIEPFKCQLFNDLTKDTILWSMYFNIPSCAKCQNSDKKLPNSVCVACGPYFELDYDETIQLAKTMFIEIYPNDEFLPRAPDPEEIIIEGESATDPSDSIIGDAEIESKTLKDANNEEPTSADRDNDSDQNAQTDS